jgi:hypothetical protein
VSVVEKRSRSIGLENCASGTYHTLLQATSAAEVFSTPIPVLGKLRQT